MTFFPINNNILLQKLNALNFKNDIGYIYFKSALLFVFIYASGYAGYTSCIFHIIILHVWFYLWENANILTQGFLYWLIPPRCISYDIYKHKTAFSFTYATILYSIKNNGCLITIPKFVQWWCTILLCTHDIPMIY